MAAMQFRRLLAAVLVILAAMPALAVDPLVDTGIIRASITVDALRAKIEETEAASDLEATTRARLIELYRNAISAQELARTNGTAATAFAEAKKNAGDKTRQLREEIDKYQNTTENIAPPGAEQLSVDELAQRTDREKANAASLDAMLGTIEEQLASENNRPTQARQELTEAHNKLAELADDLSAKPGTDLSPALVEAQRWVQESHQAEVAARIRMLDQELTSQPARLELLSAKRDRISLKLKRAEARVEYLESLLTRKRGAEANIAQGDAERAQRKAAGKHPLVQDLAKRNAELSERLTLLAHDLEAVASADDEALLLAKRIDEEARSARKKLEIAGLNQVLGQILIEQKRRLPDQDDLNREIEKQESKIGSATLSRLQSDEERRALLNLDEYLQNLTADLAPQQSESIAADLRDLATQRKTLLGQAIATNDAYLQSLGELDTAQRRLRQTVQAYDAFLDKRLLWIRNAPLPGLEDLTDIPAQIVRLMNPTAWRNITLDLWNQATRSPLPALLAIVLAGLWVESRRFRSALRESCRKTGKPSSDRLQYTFQALLLTLLLALPWPLLTAATGWLLLRSEDFTPLNQALAYALLFVSPPLFYLRFAQLMCLREGLAARHFRWSASVLIALRRVLAWQVAVFIPAAFLSSVLLQLDPGLSTGGLGRLTLLVTLLALAVWGYRLFEPRNGILLHHFRRHPDSSIKRFRHLWLTLALAVPTALAGLAVAGYMYTSTMLTEKLIDSQWLLLGLLLVHQLAKRWLLIARRRLALEAALAKRQAALAKRQAELQGETGSQDPEPGAEGLDDAVDLATLSAESGKLLGTAVVLMGFVGLWLIWSGVLPALAILEDTTLWYNDAIVDGVSKQLPVTLADGIVAVIVLGVALLAMRRLPALVEIILLQRFAMTAGDRYTVTTLLNYLIFAVGLVIFFRFIGADWSKLQWLFAALSLGIGFGLQEIVANFISGIIILFERPIRVGDVITIGTTDGTVTRIRIRATTIRNWDHKELLVPNKEFITGHLLNWTLSDQITRILLPVGVAYGADVPRAMKLMIEAAVQNDNVLANPVPSAAFEQFGDNSLALNLRCYVDSIDDRVPTISALHQAINDKLNEAGIAIAFPQRDVHLDMLGPLDVRIHHQPG